MSMRSSGETKSQSVALALPKEKLEQLRTYSTISGWACGLR